MSDQVVPDSYLDQAAEVGGLVAGAVFEVLYQDRRPASGPGVLSNRSFDRFLLERPPGR